jgi:hypothetical protein
MSKTEKKKEKKKKKKKKECNLLKKWDEFFKQMPKTCPVKVHLGKWGEDGRGRGYQT